MVRVFRISASDSLLESLISQQRCPLTVLANNLSAREGIPAQKSRNTNRKRQNKKDAADSKRENPLQLQNRQLAQELADAGGCTALVSDRVEFFGEQLTECQDGQRKANGVVLVCSKEEHAVSKPTPDEHISHNPTHKMRRMERDSTNPVQRGKVPRQRSRDSCNVDSAWGRRVAEIQEAQVEEVDDEQQFGDPEVVAHPEVDEAEEQQV